MKKNSKKIGKIGYYPNGETAFLSYTWELCPHVNNTTLICYFYYNKKSLQKMFPHLQKLLYVYMDSFKKILFKILSFRSNTDDILGDCCCLTIDNVFIYLSNFNFIKM